jgi:hypothetical protein
MRYEVTLTRTSVVRRVVVVEASSMDYAFWTSRGNADQPGLAGSSDWRHVYVKLRVGGIKSGLGDVVEG